MTSAPLRIGVVGVGALAQRGILPHLTQPDVADRVVVAALCDPVEERAREVAGRFGVPEAFASIEELGVARVSYGPYAQRVALTALQRLVEDVHAGGGLPDEVRPLN